ncbi:MAG: NTP transferase domain-containing protein [Acidobacteria bacterium]|nr:NTP transferase domain-containing protein [Acidobacteriota bacterium]
MLPTVVLTAGLGTRLDPITRYVAKPAVPMAGKTLIERVLEWLHREGINDVVLNLHHLPESITSVVGDGGALGVRVRYSWEPVILGSAGGPKQALTLWPGLTGPCLIVNGDTLTDVPLTPLIEAHRASGARVTMAVVPNTRPDHYNGIRVDANLRVTDFVAKGHTDQTWHFVGVQIVNADVFDTLPAGAPAETVAGVYRDLVRTEPGAVHVWTVEAPFLDVGTAADYIAAVLHTAGTETFVVEGTSVVDSSAVLTRCVVWDGATVGPGATLTDCVVLTGAHVPAGTVAARRVFEGV